LRTKGFYPRISRIERIYKEDNDTFAEIRLISVIRGFFMINAANDSGETDYLKTIRG
jgi:hypothetical protein